ncbi:hypothetical protein I6G37_09805 [Serratia rubidaea]|nr:hypothetical protein I6G37_09805 [Serratia rubidaea]
MARQKCLISYATNSYQFGNKEVIMVFKRNHQGKYIFTVSGLVSWTFTSFEDGIRWAFTERLAIDTANKIGAK